MPWTSQPLFRATQFRIWLGVAGIILMHFTMSAIGQEIRNRDQSNENFNARLGPTTSDYYFPGGHPSRDFKLGIYGRNTETGVLIQSVLPSSPAQRARLEAGDIIVTVEGYQVGLVSGRLYDLNDELARRVDASGSVRLLVRNHRNGQLTNLTVRFEEDRHRIRGRISYNDRTRVLPSATILVRLLDVTHSSWRDLVVQQLNLGVPQRWPIEFEMPVNLTSIMPNHRYAVDARLVQAGAVIASTDQPVRISLSGSSSRANLTLKSNAVPMQGDSPLDQIREWYRRYLGRPPSDREMSAWQRELDRGRSPQEIEASILGGTEYFERHHSDEQRFMDQVFRDLRGSSPSAEQRQRLREMLEQKGGLRLPFMQELLEQRGDGR